nr:ring-box protein 1 [Cryptomonas paramecium]
MKQKNPRKINLIKMTAIFSWNNVAYNNMCMICHCEINELLFNLQNKILLNQKKLSDYQELLIGKGTCGHIFHLNCIEKWLTRTQTCPLCRKTWFYREILEIF